MSVSSLRFGAVFIAPKTASSALNAIVSNQDFRKRGPEDPNPNLLGRQFLAGLTGVERLRDGAPVFFVPINIQGGLTDPVGQQYLKSHGVETGDLVIVTGQSIGDIQAGTMSGQAKETPEHFVLKELMFKPLDVRLLPEKQVEKTLDDLLPYYAAVPGSVPPSLMQQLKEVHNQAHKAEIIDLKPAQQVRTTADTLAAYANALYQNAKQAQVQIQKAQNQALLQQLSQAQANQQLQQLQVPTFTMPVNPQRQNPFQVPVGAGV